MAARKVTLLGVPLPPRQPQPSASDTVPPEDRELILKELRRAEQRTNELENKLAALREEQAEERAALAKRVAELEHARLEALAAKPEPAQHGTSKPSWAMHLGGWLVGAAGLVTAIAGLSKPPAPETKAERVYDAVRTEIERQARDTQTLRKDVAELSGWLAGWIRASGSKVAQEPGAPTVPQIKVEIEPPRPGTKRPAPKPVQVVKTPIPAISPATRPPRLPSSASEL